MLQKIIVVLLGFMVSVVGALAPSGLFAQTSLEGETSLAAGFSEETLATADASGGAFVRVNALWIEVDGLRVTDDAFGTGSVKEIRFKVGVRDVDDKFLVIGDKRIDLRPTDVITIRMFNGEFAYRDVGPAGATLQLQGTVKTTLVKDGSATNRLRTEVGAVDATQASRAGDSGSVAYVVLETGARVDTVAVEDGGHRLFTEEAASAAAAENTPGDLVARWVKLDGHAVREYTWGDGQVARIEFEPAEAAARSVVVAYNGQATEVFGGQRVVIEDFVGEYTIYESSGGLMKLRLDGYAGVYRVGNETLPAIPLDGDDVPNPYFDIFPPNPRTSDTIQFTDRSTDDGIIVFTTWDFDGQGASVLQNPTHRFRSPGIYHVTLTVTDDDLNQKNYTRAITVRNADPVPDFDFSPKIVATDSVVTFTDRSVDTDGTVTNWTWDFGDGNGSSARNPNHRFVTPGNATVTLSVRDELGGVASITKVIIVRNAVPTARFTYSHPDLPQDAMSGTKITFLDNSSDRDGSVVDWRWTFGDGADGTGSNATHAYSRPGTYTVTLTAYDDKGDKGSVSQQIRILNRPAIVDFTFAPDVISANTPVSFRSLARDPDGSILHQEWSFSDDGSRSLGATTTHAYSGAGTYWVNLTVTDSSAERSWLNKTITVDNTAPRARFGATPAPALRGQPVDFLDLSTDPDGDALASWRWSFGDGNTSTQRNATHAYSALGTYTVTLNVTDVSGRSAEVSQPFVVLNSRPQIETMTIQPGIGRPAITNETVWFNATASDADFRPGDELEYRWTFAEGTYTGANLKRTFAAPGTYTATLVVRDLDGAESPLRRETFVVDLAPPISDFVVAPATPSTNQEVQFTDLSFSPNGDIRSWSWEFGDGTRSSLQNPTHRYQGHGPKTVHLTVTDAAGRTNTTSRTLLVNGLPTAFFEMTPAGTIAPGTTVTFRDRSTDPEGDLRQWTWNFGDGTLLTTTSSSSPNHTFTQPGTKLVTLTVEDGSGAIHTSTQTLHVANQPPRARFTISPMTPVAQSPATFTSTSYDPDGTPVQSHSWSFGDGQVSNEVNPTHTFGASGNYVVSLRVSDGELTSPVDSESFRILRVAGATPFEGRIEARYTDNRVVDLSDPTMDASLRLVVNNQVAQHLPKSMLIQDGSALVGTFAAGSWAKGDRILFTLRNTTFGGTQTLEYVIASDSVTQVTKTFTLAMPAVPYLDVAPGERDLLPLLGANRTTAGIPVYQDALEPVHGNGTLRFLDQVPVSNTLVEIQFRYLPLSSLTNLNPDTGSGERPIIESIRGWCKVGEARTDANGDYTWRASMVLCQSTPAMLPGVYQARAVTRHSGEVYTSPTVSKFIVDPTGVIVPLVETVLT